MKQLIMKHRPSQGLELQHDWNIIDESHCTALSDVKAVDPCFTDYKDVNIVKFRLDLGLFNVNTVKFRSST